MSWDRARPNGKTRDAKYASKEHRDTRKAYRQQLERDGFLTCAQPICLHRSRLILPGMAWAAGHDDTGTRYLGPVHQRCNNSDGGRRARARQISTTLRW